MLLLPFALASAGTPEPEELPDDDVPADVLVRDLPLARYPKDDADAWFGVTPPTFGWAPDFGASLGLELNARVSTRLAWLQPELRLAYDQSFDPFSAWTFRVMDLHVVALVGPRFGLDHGVYGGVAVGAQYVRDEQIDNTDLRVSPTGLVYGGYAFRAGDRMRVSPELSLGVRNTVALRLEWGG